MRTRIPSLPSFLIVLVTLALPACEPEPPPRPAPAPAPQPKKVSAGKNITLEILGSKRRVLIESRVCLREGALEQLLTRKGTKEHEAIVTADVDGRDIHKALLAAGATPGAPVEFVPKYKAAHGTVIKVFVQWEEKGKLRTEPAQTWVQDVATKQDLKEDWVFAGSRFVSDPDKIRPDYYLANDGDLICVANFPTALLDLPIRSSSSDAELSFVAHTDRIPPRNTRVVVILEPVLEKGPAVSP